MAAKLEGEYRGVKFQRTPTGHWIFESFPPSRWAHWSRFFTTLEQTQIAPASPLSLKQQEEIMRTAIDRMHNDAPIFTGDIRDQPSA